MAVYDLKDQEEIENFKYFWRSWGRWLFALLVVAAIGYFGWGMYSSHQRNVNNEAVAVFDQWAENQQANKPAEAAKLLRDDGGGDGSELAQSSLHLLLIAHHQQPRIWLAVQKCSGGRSSNIQTHIATHCING